MAEEKMFYGIIKNQISGFQINRIIVVLFLIYAAAHFSGCAIRNRVQPNDESLKTRINQFYTYFKDGKHGECWSIIEEKSRGDKKEYVDFAEKHSLKLINFKIDAISVDGFNAKVTMTMTMLDKNSESVSETVDCWVFENGNWYIRTAGKPLDWICK
jgi:hypothetical protein